MIIITSYRLEEQADFCFVRTNEAGNCPICGGRLTVRGERQRIVKESDEKEIKLMIRRMKCDRCGKLHHELPDCIVPYKRYSAGTIEAIIEGKDGGIVCEIGTIRRIRQWWKIAVEYYLNILKTLAEKYEIQFHEPPLFKEIIRAVVNSNNWICSKIICTRSELATG